ncbi:alpha-xylosidase [Modestobacter sp. VKM Ac-2986]|uniref:alpha-xylosidase n=1 Tax=Modestobacter sp. VKM Ac-2986 TaxID=3004140 RepID=UPI0022AB4404|nr:alpha-xylosidase [Modestobacter sp. VKM Ac-2986]MCZ2827270.1 alpha-xylosidase [Modestobacter sp. VKM Ac-2986]
MKFTDGYWQDRAGFSVLRPRDVRAITAAADSMTVLAPTAVIRERGNTLNQPAVTITYSSPAPDVIRVRIEHWAGGVPRRPEFAVAEDPSQHVKVEVDAEAGVLTSGGLSVRVPRGPGWLAEFVADGRVLTSSGSKSVGIVTTDAGEHHVHEQLALAVDEHVYGLGERFTPFVRNGQVVDVWNADGGTSSEQAYKNVPFYLSDRGYGVFVAHPEHVSFEVASEVVSRTQFSVPGQTLEYYVVNGPTPKDVLRRYTALTGRPPQVPAWSYGLWLSTSFTTDYDEATVTSFIEGMAERDIPLSVFHFDCFWMREFRWCDFEWDPEVFPEPEEMLARLKARGLRVCVWINPYIAQASPLFAEAAAQGFLVRRADGSVWQWDMWQAGMGLVDFTNPGAVAWYQGKLRGLLDMGVDAFKTDFGERIPTDVVWHDGSDPQRMHNYYAQAYNAAVFDLLREERGEGEAVVFARSATAGGQQFPVHWGGDCFSTFEAMAETLRGGLSLGLSGFGYWSHDIGGFEGTPDPEVFKRWVAFGLLSSHSRLHGSSSYRVPWAFDEEAVDVLRSFTQLKLSLMPYLGAVARQASEDGLPMARAMLLEHPDDPTTSFLDRQYHLGESLLVAPVFSADGTVRYYVPEGEWTSLLSGDVVAGPRWVTEQHDALSLPLLVRPDTVLPVGARSDRPDYDWTDGVVLRLYRLRDGHRSQVVVPGDGSGGADAVFTVERTGDLVTVTAAHAPGAWSVQVAGDAATAVPATGAASVQLRL